MEYLSENYAPFNYTDPNDGEVKGYAVELLNRVWQQLEIKPNPIKIYPWARGFSLTIHKNNTVLFSTTRIPSREVHFKWACPIYEMNVIFLGKKGDGIKLNSVQDAAKYRFAAVRSALGEQTLLDHDVPVENIFPAKSYHKSVMMLVRGRVELVAEDELTALKILKQTGQNIEDYEVKLRLSSGDLCYAFNLQVSDEVVGRFQEALNEVNRDKAWLKNLEQKYQLQQFD
ncbi:substrate-binding periplasmic protein [Dongshaea marina]|uniref:substrate-binding periplasmic protein n=1 Tax=Dongshaea marina TaxID=2047966 RepID=UPI00131F3931|nr:transporter substrate-binding domain-containing protein [Dongshaea marina]